MEGEAIGIKKGEAIGIKKGEAIGIKKGRLLQLLIIINLSPKMSSKELANHTEEKITKITALKKVLKTKHKKEIQKFIAAQFLNGIKLTRSEKIKITKLINSIIKKEAQK